ncbi:MAG: hypothetical protein R2880_13625 [Deinococcales bacterium]
MPTIKQPYFISTSQYHKMIAAGVFEGERLELLEGELIQMSPIGSKHAAFIHYLIYFFNRNTALKVAGLDLSQNIDGLFKPFFDRAKT